MIVSRSSASRYASSDLPTAVECTSMRRPTHVFIKMNTWVGRRMEVHSTAVGKSLLAYLDAEERETIIRHRGLKKLTPYTITSVTKLMKEFERVRQLGYSVDDEENSLGARCVGAPIFNSQGRVEASLGSTGTITAVPRDAVPRLAEMVKDAARRISRTRLAIADLIPGRAERGIFEVNNCPETGTSICSALSFRPSSCRKIMSIEFRFASVRRSL